MGGFLLLHSAYDNELTQRKDNNKILKKEKGEVEKTVRAKTPRIFRAQFHQQSTYSFYTRSIKRY